MNNVQSLILSHIGEEELTVGELTYRGYYQGSNVSYNVKKLVENGYLNQERSPHDRRNIKVSLSPRGRDVCKVVEELYDRHLGALEDGPIESEALAENNATLRRVERFWAHELAYGPTSSVNSAA